jgi:DNA invertase Pin-like site-specific DNA recombinase
VVEFVEHGISGATRSRPALDQMLRDNRRRRFGAVVVWSIDRLSRSVAHAAGLIEELQEHDVTLIALRQGIDTSTTAGRAFAQMASIFAEIERENIRERVRAGLARVGAAGGRLGRPATILTAADLARTSHLSGCEAATVLGVGRSILHRARLSQKPVRIAS